LQLAGQTQSKVSCHSGTYKFSGTVLQGETFSRPFGGFVFNLEPTEFGWTIDIAQGKRHYLANMTGPVHFVPNSIDIEGWHFRNLNNTSANTGEINAPDERRIFIFSPRWNRCTKATGIARDGRGVLEITDMDLSNVEEGKKASILKMRFAVRLTVALSACQPCIQRTDRD
jgi:hypothetical protein